MPLSGPSRASSPPPRSTLVGAGSVVGDSEPGVGTGNVLKVFESPAEPTATVVPLYESPRAQAGFPSPAADYVEEALDLNKFLIRNPPATFFSVVSGESMVDARIFDKDIVSVDRSLKPKRGSVVVAAADGDLFIKALEKVDGRLALVSKNHAQKDLYPPLFIDTFQDFTIWGVVTGVVRKF